MNEAVCALIKKDGKFLAVSRKNDPSDFGLPGGKVDPGETCEEALRREIMEETGIMVGGIFPVFEEVCGPGKDGKSYLVTTYKVYGFNQVRTPEESGVVAWVDKDVLLTGSFGDYNKKLFATLQAEAICF